MSWSSNDSSSSYGSSSQTSALVAMLEGGPGWGRSKKVTCPNTGCTVRGKRIELHCLWCQFPAARRLPGNRLTVTGCLKRDGGVDYVNFNQTFLASHGLVFRINEARRKMKIVCINTGGGNSRYSISFTVKNFQYKIVGRTGEKRIHKLILPDRLNSHKLIQYKISIFSQ
jgi:hypothetical protein